MSHAVPAPHRHRLFALFAPQPFEVIKDLGRIIASQVQVRPLFHLCSFLFHKRAHFLPHREILGLAHIAETLRSTHNVFHVYRDHDPARDDAARFRSISSMGQSTQKASCTLAHTMMPASAAAMLAIRIRSAPAPWTGKFNNVRGLV